MNENIDRQGVAGEKGESRQNLGGFGTKVYTRNTGGVNQSVEGLELVPSREGGDEVGWEPSLGTKTGGNKRSNYVSNYYIKEYTFNSTDLLPTGEIGK